MKIVRHRPGRRPEFWNPEAPELSPKKKALLVGIQYEDDEDGGEEGANALRGPHRDVTDMRELLIGVCNCRHIFIVFPNGITDCYEYDPGDIVVLIDRDDPGQVQPTRVNMVCIQVSPPSYVSYWHHRFERLRSWLRMLVRETVSSFTVCSPSTSVS